ncbi:3159_t:CDS:2 [Cetraspora pellucida]|uniref:3159_t:CDS:1 n=1 Tax=Cetraspora pellucida TaxID=1433469 RepID=A0A9N9CM08_9GLOM|nr:3159_t:CDS:2 [Cetraspora pellucida]
MSKKFFTDIVEDYKQLYESRDNYDVIIYAGEEPNSEEIYAHSLVLRTRSAYFRGALSSDIQDKEGETILELLVASDEFGLTRLIDHVQQYFVENHQGFLQQNPARMLHIVARHEVLNEIRKRSLRIIGSKPDIIQLKDDVTEFNQDDFKLLEKTLQRCIQYIRFHEISMPDFYHKVLPYMSILPNSLFNDILRCYMVPGAAPLYNSKEILEQEKIMKRMAQWSRSTAMRASNNGQITSGFVFRTLQKYGNAFEMNVVGVIVNYE